MSRRQRQAEQAQYDDVSDDDVSIHSENSTSTEVPESSQVVNWPEKLYQAIDDLAEKRTIVRENALKDLHNILSNHFAAAELQNKVDTLLSGLTKSLKRSGKESILAGSVLSVAVASLTDLMSESRIREQIETLEAYVTKSPASAEARANAIAALCTWRFFQNDTNDLMSNNFAPLVLLRTKLWKDSSPEIASAAIRGWTLLASALPKNTRGRVLLPRVKHQLLKLLQNPSLAVRLAAGEAIALLYESYNETMYATPLEGESQFTDGEFEEEEDVSDSEHQQEDGEEDYSEQQVAESSETAEASTETKQKKQKSKEPQLTSEEIDEQLEATLEKLASESTKKKSKSDKQIQRAAFRDILATVLGEEPNVHPVRLLIRKHKVKFSDWTLVLRYSYLKELMGNGIGNHFVDNDIIRQIFDIDMIDFNAEVFKLTKAEKKAYLSQNSMFNKESRIRKNSLTRKFSNMVLNELEA